MGKHGLVVVPHGVLESAQRIAVERAERGINMNAIAEQDGIADYSNGIAVSRFLGNKVLGPIDGSGHRGLPAQKMLTMCPKSAAVSYSNSKRPFGSTARFRVRASQ